MKAGRIADVKERDEKPVVSVIVPSRNEKRTINKCLQALFSQTYESLQIIVVDSSDDSTHQTIEKLITQEKSKVVYVHSEKPLTPSKARNIGLRLVGGDVITFVDADTYPERNFVAEGLKVLKRNKVVMVRARLKLLTPRTRFGKMLHTYLISTSFRQFSRERVAGVFYKRAFIKDVGGFSEDLINYEDLDFSQRCYELANRRGVSTPEVRATETVIYHDWEDGESLSNHFRRMMWYGAGLSKAVIKYPKELLPSLLIVLYLSMVPIVVSVMHLLSFIALVLLLPYLFLWPYFLYKAAVARCLNWTVPLLPLLVIYKALGDLAGLVAKRLIPEFKSW